METARDIAKLIQGDPDYSLSVDMIEDEIKGYAKRKCKEQRELCQEELYKGNPKIRHAPEPNFDK